MVDKSLTIQGASSRALTKLVPGANTTLGSNLPSEAFIYVAPGGSLTLEDLEIDCAGWQIHHAVQSRGTLTVDNCEIKNVEYSTYYGRGIVLFGGTADIDNVVFTNIERIGIHVRGAVETPAPVADISNITYTGKGTGTWLDYAIEFGGGGSGIVDNLYATGCLGVASDGSTSAAVLVTDYFGTGTVATIKNSTLTNNTTGVAIGYDDDDQSRVTGFSNKIYGNDEGVSTSGSTVVANFLNNWWGAANGPLDNSDDRSTGGLWNPLGEGDAVSDNVDYQPWYNDMYLEDLPVDIWIENPSCNHIVVKVKPHEDILGAYLTNGQFTIAWDADVYCGDISCYPFQNISSFYNIAAQYTIIVGDVQYVYCGWGGGDPNPSVNWSYTNEYVLFECDLNQEGSTFEVTDFVIARDAYAGANNMGYYMQIDAIDRTGLVTEDAEDVYTGSCDLTLDARVFLQGPYDVLTNQMKPDINAFIPLSQPFNVAPWNYSESISITSKPADMIDWVLVELRSYENTMVHRQAGLLYKDGSIRSAAGAHPDIFFASNPANFMPNDDFYVVIYQRNHMPVMSLAKVNIPNTPMLDFADVTKAYGYNSSGPTEQPLVILETGVYGMISGDYSDYDVAINHAHDGRLIYSAGNNDRGPIIAKITAANGVPYINGVINNAYLNEDLTMNGQVRYSGSGNDPRLIIQNLIELKGSNNLNNVYESKVPGWVVTTPKAGTHPNPGPVDIALVDGPQELLVNIYTNEALYGALTDNIQFTLCWNEDDAAAAGLVSNYSGDYKLEPQGEPVTFNGKAYQTFVVVDALLLPDPFLPGQEVTLLKFYKDGFSGDAAARIGIAGDSWTETRNGDYYLSIWGVNHTGDVLDNALGIGEPTDLGTMSLYPNPVAQGWLKLALAPAATEVLALTLSDISGRIVSEQAWSVTTGSVQSLTLSLAGLEKGTYTLRVQGARSQAVRKIIVQ